MDDDNWFSVTVRDADGDIVTIEPNMLSGGDQSEIRTEKIREAAMHLLGFIGPPTHR